jgi:hypothetical protein
MTGHKIETVGTIQILTICSLLAVYQAGCAKSTSSSGTLAVRGTLSTASTTSGSAALLDLSPHAVNKGLISVKGYSGTHMLVDYSTMQIACTTQDGNSTTTAGAIKSNGTFSVSIPGGAQVPMSCILENSSTGNPVGSIIISKSSKDLSGKGYATSDQFKAGNSANLGSVSYDPTTQEATVSAAQATGLINDSLSAGEAFDPTGSWALSDVTKLDPGFRGLCGPNHENGQCDGPSSTDSVYMIRLVGKSTLDSSTVFGIQLWQDKTAAASCGDMTGLSDAQAALAEVTDITGATAGPFGFTTSNINYSNSGTNYMGESLTSGYKLTSAKTLWPMQTGCGPKTVTVSGVVYNAWVCTDGVLYQSFLNGGCVDSNNNPVNVMNWGSINSCNSTTGSDGYTTQTCTGTYNSSAVTCTNVYGVFSDVALTVSSNGTFNWGALTNIAAGTSCSSGSMSALQQVQCYAQWYQQSLGNSQDDSLCLPKVNTDWTSTDASTFVEVDYRPSTLIFMDKLNYETTPSGVQTAVMRTSQTQIRGVPSHANGRDTWIPCKVQESDVLRMTKTDATHMRVTYVSSQFTPDTGKDACVAAFGKAGGETVQKFQFKVTKQ